MGLSVQAQLASDLGLQFVMNMTTLTGSVSPGMNVPAFGWTVPRLRADFRPEDSGQKFAYMCEVRRICQQPQFMAMYAGHERTDEQAKGVVHIWKSGEVCASSPRGQCAYQEPQVWVVGRRCV